MHYVAALNYYNIIPLLVKHGSDINARTEKDGLTPLMIAAAKGYEKSVRKLVRLGALF